VLHGFPEGIVAFLLLKRAGFNRQKSIWLAFLAAAVSTPPGALISFSFIKQIQKTVWGQCWLSPLERRSM